MSTGHELDADERRSCAHSRHDDDDDARNDPPLDLRRRALKTPEAQQPDTEGE